MKTNTRVISLLVLVCLVVGLLAGCQPNTNPPASTTAGPQSIVDYTAETKLVMDSPTKKQEVTVKNFVDGDTTHFNAPADQFENGVLKARYLAVNTPESTGQIEAWGKKASNFTKEKLSSADSIIVESDDEKWNMDSNGRHLVWVWYRPAGHTEYRCLNIELVQNGLSQAAGSTTNRYGTASMNAFMQSKLQKLNVHSGEKDPDFYYGDAFEIDLKGLRTNTKLYEGKKVAFEGVITRYNGNSLYIEEYDAETGLYFGISVFDGYATGELMNILKIGNRVRVVGTLTYYETGGTWQVSGLTYRAIRPNDPNNTQLISTGNAAGNPVTDPDTFLNGKVTIETLKELGGEETVATTFRYADLAMSTSISMKNLYVKDIYTTHNGGDNDGAMTLTCEVDGHTVTVRTAVLRNADKELYTEKDFLNKTIDVTGIVDFFSGEYQIKVFSAMDINIHE